jgi:predicted nucleotidyltransferase
MQIEEILRYKDQIYQIAAKYNITKVFVFGSVARGEGDETSDIDFLIEMEAGASALGVGGFQYEVQKLLGIPVDVIPAYIIPKVDDREFVQNIRTEAVAL